MGYWEHWDGTGLRYWLIVVDTGSYWCPQLGRRMAELPVEPMLAKMILASEQCVAPLSPLSPLSPMGVPFVPYGCPLCVPYGCLLCPEWVSPLSPMGIPIVIYACPLCVPCGYPHCLLWVSPLCPL